MTTEIERRLENEQPKKVKAVIREFNGGRYGKAGEYIAIVELCYFKNGKFKKTDFRLVEFVERTKKGYGCGNCRHTESIEDILEIVD